MPSHYDRRELRDPEIRERDLFRRLPVTLAAALKIKGWRRQLGKFDPRDIRDRQALAALPILRKSDLPEMQKAEPPFAGLVPGALGRYGRLFTSPGPIFEPEATGSDPWGGARGLFAAGIRRGDVVLNTFSYHLTPGGFMMDGAARALGAAVIPAGPGNTEQQLALIAAYRPSAYLGTPDFLKILIDTADKAGTDRASLVRAVVSGAAFPASLQKEVRERGIDAYQCYATADLGTVAYETPARAGMVLNEDMIVEIVRPGTGDPVEPGEIGEIVVTTLDPTHPIVRLALGDLTATLPGASPCGRTNQRIRGWLGRADQTAKVKGMFVRPTQIAEIARRHPELGRLRLVITRKGEQDAMVLKAETANGTAPVASAVAETMQAILKLKGEVALVTSGSLPLDGKVIADERPVG